MKRELLALSVVVLVLPMPACLGRRSSVCRILSASMLSILCMPLYIGDHHAGLLLNTRPRAVIFGIMGVLDPLRLPLAVIPTRSR